MQKGNTPFQSNFKSVPSPIKSLTFGISVSVVPGSAGAITFVSAMGMSVDGAQAIAPIPSSVLSHVPVYG